MESRVPLIAQIVGAVVGVIGVILFLMVAMNEERAANFVSYGYYIAILGAIVAVASSAIGLAVNPKGVKNVAIGLGAVVVVAVLSYLMADGSDFESFKGGITEVESKRVSAMLTAFYIIFIGAVGSVVFSLVSRVVK